MKLFLSNCETANLAKGSSLCVCHEHLPQGERNEVHIISEMRSVYSCQWFLSLLDPVQNSLKGFIKEGYTCRSAYWPHVNVLKMETGTERAAFFFRQVWMANVFRSSVNRHFLFICMFYFFKSAIQCETYDWLRWLSNLFVVCCCCLITLLFYVLRFPSYPLGPLNSSQEIFPSLSLSCLSHNASGTSRPMMFLK